MNKDRRIMIEFSEEQFIRIHNIQRDEEFDTVQDAIMMMVIFWTKMNQKK
jgi:hypothetical protein